MSKSNKTDIVDLFCGVGGFSCGAKQAGHHIALLVDNHDAVLSCAGCNFPEAKVVNLTLGTVESDNIIMKQISNWSKTHIHASPPCTSLSNANKTASDAERMEALRLLGWCIEFALNSGCSSYSVENVSTPIILDFVRQKCALYPDRMDYITLDCASFGVPQARRRLIISSPHIVNKLRNSQNKRCTVRQALGNVLASDYVKNAATSVKKKVYLRSVDEIGFTVTASRCLTFCDREGNTVRGMHPSELAALQTFPPGWKLPSSFREQIKAIGNAIPPLFAKCIMSICGTDEKIEAKNGIMSETCLTSTCDRCTGCVLLEAKVRRIETILQYLL